jgi:hypothetical protein
MNASFLPSPTQDQIIRPLEAAPAASDASELPPPASATADNAAAQTLTKTDLTACKQTSCSPDPRFVSALQSLQTLTAQASEIRQTASGPVTEQIATCFAATLADAWLRRPVPQSASASPLQPAQDILRYLFPLRRGDQDAEWLQIRRQWLILAEQKRQDRLAAQKAASAPYVRGPRPDGGITKETLAEMERKLNLF